MELLKSSSESMVPDALVSGVAGSSTTGVWRGLGVWRGSGVSRGLGVFCRGCSAGLRCVFASEAFRLRAVGGVVV
jgi:hypothetical protein